jgi:hypothetical protein
MNEESSLYWFDKPLIYTEHARIRCYERGTPFLDYLPLDAKFVCKKTHKSMKLPMFKFVVNYNNKLLCILVNDNGVVATTYFIEHSNRVKVKKEKPTVKNYDKYPYLEVVDQLYDYA